MRRMLPGLAAFLICVFSAAPALALDPATKQAVCNEIQQSAAGALETAIKVYVPKRNPSRTFDDATKACLQLIVQYNKIPMGMLNMGALQPILQKLGEDLLMKECSAAADRFNRTLNEALAERGLSYSGGNLSYSGTIDGVQIGASTAGGGSVNVNGNNGYLGNVTGNASGNGTGSVGSSNTGGLVNWGGNGGTCTGKDCK